MLILQLSNFTGIQRSSQGAAATQIAMAIIVCIILIIITTRMYKSFIMKLEKVKSEAPRKKLDIQAFRKAATRLGFTKNDLTFFEQMCKLFNITYVPLISNTEYCITTVCKKIYDGIVENQENLSAADVDTNKLTLFMLMNKIEEAKRGLSLLTSTTAFSEGLSIAYITEDGVHHPSRIIENSKVGLFIEVALSTSGHLVQPIPLSKIQLYLELQGGIAYRATTRVMRYQSRNGVEELVVIHSNDVEFFQRRKFRRKDVDIHCNFSAVKVIEDEQTGKKNYEANEKKYSGVVANISATGCRLTTTIPIRADQHMQISCPFPDGNIGTMTGIIVRSRKELHKSVCVLNIRFLRMQKKTQNSIFSYVYDYEGKVEEVVEENKVEEKTEEVKKKVKKWR